MNDALRADPLYLGVREKPPSAEELDELAGEFVQAVQEGFPGFEDWKGTDAIRMLKRYVGMCSASTMVSREPPVGP